MGEELFRKSALDKLASPERLDVLMEVTSGKGWIALVTIGGIGAGLALWSVFGTIPDRIDGQGIMIRGGGLRQVRATGDGTLTKLTITLNDVVTEAQVVGEISQIGSSEEIKSARAQLDAAQNDYEKSKVEDEATIEGIRATIAGYEADRRGTQVLLQNARVDLTKLNESLKAGLVTRSRVDQAERDVAGFQASLTGKDAQISSQNAQIRSVQQRIRAKQDAVTQAQQALQRVSVVTSAMAQIQSTVEGHVIELRHRAGDFVRNGEVIATLEAPSSSIEPVVYVGSGFGKRVKPGMEAQVSPTTVRREEYGFMKGSVQIAGEYPVTEDAVKSVTGNDQLVKELLASGTKIEVHIGLQPNAATPSGYAWSSSSGPPFKIDGGTRVSVAVVAAKTSPFNYYVTPYIRSIIGG
jgi:HlyD family secretion protein